MKKLNDKKISVLAATALTVSLVMPTVQMIPAEETEVLDQYMIIELEPLAKPEVDVQETENSSEEQSTEEFSEVVSESDTVLFALNDFIGDDYSITGISMDEPIIAQLLSQTTGYQDYDSIALYDLISNQQSADSLYDFNLQIPEDADVTLYQTIDGQLQPDTKPTIPTTVAPTTITPTTSPSTTAPTKTPETQPQTTAHTHAWVPVTKVVHHDATYKTVWVQDSAAWDETVITKAAWDEQVLVQDAYDENVMISDAYDEPVYAWVEVCNACGHKFLDPNEDINEHMAAGCWSSWHGEWMQVGTTHHDAVYQTVHHEATYQTVHHEAETTIVHHDATGHNEQTVDQAAWDETVITGYTCSVCGAAKEK